MSDEISILKDTIANQAAVITNLNVQVSNLNSIVANLSLNIQNLTEKIIYCYNKNETLDTRVTETQNLLEVTQSSLPDIYNKISQVEDNINRLNQLVNIGY